MSNNESRVLIGDIAEEREALSLTRLCELCGAEGGLIEELVEEGVLEVASSTELRFAGTALRRARIAVRLRRDLGVNTAGVAIVIDLLERIETLEVRLGR
jgi:chaperone modulatory protein CbpM